MTVPDETGHLSTSDGLALWWGRWAPRQPAGHYALINVHGLGDHSGLYPMVAEFFSTRGVPVWAFDARGNGRSPGRQGHVDRWATYRDDLHRFVGLVRERDGLPIALLGHSLGGLMVLDFAIEHPGEAAAIAAAAPPLGSIGTSPALIALATVVSGIWPGFRLQTGLDLSRVARDPAVRDAILSDPLFHRWASARLGTETLKTRDRIHRDADQIRDPVLILHGDDDQMVSIDGSRRLAARLRGRVMLREYPGAWHALFADVGHEARLADLAAWLAQVIPHR
jgi:alpha-beta hydrolase superfamily lysophospholipase